MNPKHIGPSLGKRVEKPDPIIDRSPEYHAWKAIRQRCSAGPDSKDYQYWAGRGIKVCERWNEFQYFLEDMGPRPTPKHSLDRVNCDGDYEPSNCRWATPAEQSQNRRSMGGNWRRA